MLVQHATLHVAAALYILPVLCFKVLHIHNPVASQLDGSAATMVKA